MMLRLPILRFFFDLVVLVIVVVSILLVKNLANPRENGFFCNDLSIRYPFRTGSISSKVLYTVGFGLPVLVIFFAELLRTLNEIKLEKCEIASYLKVGQITSLRSLVGRLYRIIGHFILEGCLTDLLIQCIKFYFGELRPHFIDVCQPNWSVVTNNSTECVDTKIFVNSSALCTTENLGRLREARLSFPSGHASAAFYSMIFLILYMEARVESRWLFLHSLKPLSQFVCLLLASLTALSRVVEYEHHWLDVIAGGTIGLAVAIFTACYIINLWGKIISDSPELPLINRDEYTKIKDDSKGNETCLSGLY